MSSQGPALRSTGMPAAAAAFLAISLLPARASTSGGGPMNVMPASRHARARSGFSARNP